MSAPDTPQSARGDTERGHVSGRGLRASYRLIAAALILAMYLVAGFALFLAQRASAIAQDPEQSGTDGRAQRPCAPFQRASPYSSKAPEDVQPI
jgi:hypothetical protein